MKRKEPHSPEEHLQQNSLLEKMRKVGKDDTEQNKHKEEKYDRQLRLWGQDGQNDLEEAHVCLLNVTTAGVEALKCLVLPGIGKFSIVDDTKICDEDIGNNFFFDSHSVGQSKAEIACRLLQELNPDTVGLFVSQNPIELLDNDPEFFKSVNVVICSRLNERNLLKLSNHFWQHRLPVIVCDNFGFFGILRLAIKEHAVIESHPDNTLEDLRLDQPFPELIQYMDNIHFDRMEQCEHSHTPYLVILYKYLQNWRKETGKVFPRNYQEKQQIKDMIRKGILKNEFGVEIHEENFEEAIQNVNNTLVGAKLSDNVQMVLNDEMSDHPQNSETNSKFWILVRALKEFVNQNGVLPFRGSLPDMFSDSKRYIELQNIFKAKASADSQLVAEFVREVLEDLQLPISFISQKDIQLFCKNASFIHVQRGFSLHDEFKQNIAPHKIKDDQCSDIYLIYRAILRFADQGYFPVTSQGHGKDSDEIRRILSDLFKDLSLDKQIPDDYLVELFRCNASELHTTAAIMGGLCSQEVIKIITKQFVPIDNTYIYDGISHQSSTLKLL